MKNSAIYILLVVCGGVIAYIMLGGIFKNELKKPAKNPYEFDLGDIGKIDPSLIQYKETQRLALTIDNPKVIDYQNGLLGIGYLNHLQVIDTLGQEVFNREVDGPVTGIAFAPNGDILLASKTVIRMFGGNGELLSTWDALDSSSHITSMAVNNEHVFAADAGGPLVHQYNLEGKLINSFDGKNMTDRKHGFIIPSPHFDLDLDSEGQLWAANTGVQALENYHEDGTMRGFWGASSYDLEGFIGCCNPAQFTILTNGSFVTCEKGLVRIKVYQPSGEFDSVVATPEDFNKKSEPTDLTSDEANNIYALDISRSIIRKFERKNS